MSAEVLDIGHDASAELFGSEIVDDVPRFRDKPQSFSCAYGFVSVVYAKTSYGKLSGVEVLVPVNLENRLSVIVVACTVLGKAEPVDTEFRIVPESIDGIGRKRVVWSVCTESPYDLVRMGVYDIGSVAIGRDIELAFAIGIEVVNDRAVHIDIGTE